MNLFSLLSFKVFAAIIIFFLTIIAGLFPLRFAKKHKEILYFGDAFASGVFLSAAFIHLLPEAESSFSLFLKNSSYPFAQFICIITFVFLLLIESALAEYKKKHLTTTGNNVTTPYILTLVLAIHSVMEGAAIGINASVARTLIIFIAVIAHKGSESFALASNLHRYELNLKNISRIITWFAFATPIGIIISSIIRHALHTPGGEIIDACFSSIAAGTFFYLGSIHVAEEMKSYKFFREVTALLLGVALMSIIAIWV